MKSFFRDALRFVGSVPALIGSIIPVFKACPPCPVCMPIYAGILSLLGLELADYSEYIVPIMLVSMSITILSLALQARRTHGRQLALWLALSGCSVICTAKFVLDFLPLVYCGMALLISAIWLNRRYSRQVPGACCDHHQRSCSEGKVA